MVGLILASTSINAAFAQTIFIGLSSAFVLFFFFYKKSFKKYTCVVCKGRGSLPKKFKWSLGSTDTCYSCHGEGTVNKTNYNELLKYSQVKRKETFAHMRKLNKEIRDLQRSVKFNQEIIKPTTLNLVEKKIGAYQRQVAFREKVLAYLDKTEANIHKILANIYLLKKVQSADTSLKETYQEKSEEDFKELFTRQGRLEFDLSRLEGELYSLEKHLEAAEEEVDISNELNAEIDYLTEQMNRLLKD